MQSLDRIHPAAKANMQWNGFYFDNINLFYVATPKVACTSLKWWLARAVGIDKKILSDDNSNETTIELKIHDLFGKYAPNINLIDWENIQKILKNDLIFKFALTRNPYVRVFSAWQSKWLLCEPLQVERYRDTEIFNPTINSIDDLAKSFQIFLEYIYKNEYPDILDSHLTLQVDLLGVDWICYDRVVKIEDSYNFLNEISLKWFPNFSHPLSGARYNEGLFSFSPEFLTVRSQQLIKLIYARDFEKFSYPLEPPRKSLYLTDEANGLINKY